MSDFIRVSCDYSPVVEGYFEHSSHQKAFLTPCWVAEYIPPCPRIWVARNPQTLATTKNKEGVWLVRANESAMASQWDALSSDDDTDGADDTATKRSRPKNRPVPPSWTKSSGARMTLRSKVHTAGQANSNSFQHRREREPSVDYDSFTRRRAEGWIHTILGNVRALLPERLLLGVVDNASKLAQSQGQETSLMSLVHELEWQEAKVTGYMKAGSISFPRERWKLVWDSCVIAIICYSVIVVPFRIGFDAPATGAVYAVETSASLFLLVELFLNFNTAYLEARFWVVDRWAVARQYLLWPTASKSCFWIDAPGAVPVEVLELAAAHGVLAIAPSTLYALRAWQLMRTVRFFILDWKAFFQVRRLDHHKFTKAFSGVVGGMTRMILVMLYWVHVLGCGWYYVSRQAHGHEEGTQRSWVEEYEGGYASDPGTSKFDRYVVAVYWSMGMVTGQEVDLVPHNQAERKFAIVSNVICAMVLAYVIAGVTDAITAARTQAPPVEDVKEFARWHELPIDLSRRMTEYAEYFWSERRLSPQAETAVLSNLRPALRHAVFSHILSTSVEHFKLLSRFDGASSPQGLIFKEQIYLQLKPCVFERGEIIMRQGETSEVIYFLRSDVGHNSSQVDARLNFLEDADPADVDASAPRATARSRRGGGGGGHRRAKGYGALPASPGQKYQRNSTVASRMRMELGTSVIVQSFAAFFASPFRYFGEESIGRRCCPVDYVAETRVEAYALSVSALRMSAEQAFKRKPSCINDLERVIVQSILLKLKLRFAQFDEFLLNMDIRAKHQVAPETLYFAARFQRAYRVRELVRLLRDINVASGKDVPPAVPLPLPARKPSAVDVESLPELPQAFSCALSSIAASANGTSAAPSSCNGPGPPASPVAAQPRGRRDSLLAVKRDSIRGSLLLPGIHDGHGRLGSVAGVGSPGAAHIEASQMQLVALMHKQEERMKMLEEVVQVYEIARA